MGAFAEFIQSSGSEPAAVEAPGEFSKSLRAGAYGARSQLQSAAGLTAEALGFDEFAKNRNADAAELQSQAQANAPRIGSYKQVKSLRDAGDYVTGLVGSSLPVMGAGLVGGLATGGRGAVPAMLGAAAATAPFEIGDVAQKQAADPEAMKAPASLRARDAYLAGGLSSVAQGVVPGVVAGKVLGQGAQQAAKQTLRQTIGNNLASIPMEGVTEAGGEAIKQFGANQDKPLDVEALKESFVGGAAAGGAFAGVGTAADVAHGGVASVGNTARNAASKVVDGTKSAAETVKTETPKKFKTISEDFNELVAKGRQYADGTIDKVLSGQPLVDAQTFATEAGQKMSDNESVKAATNWASDIANDAGLTPERRQQAAEFAANVTDQASQMGLAALKKTVDAGRLVSGKIEAMRQDFAAGKAAGEIADLMSVLPGLYDPVGRKAPADAAAVKQSADYSGTNKAIAEQLGPLLAKNPGLADRPADVTKLADNVRVAVEKLPSLRLNSDTMFRLIDMLGDQTMSTLSQAYRTVKADDPAAAEVFFKKLNEVNSLQQRTTKLKDLVGGALTEEAAAMIKPQQYGDLVNGLLKHARGEYDNPNAGPYELKARNEEFRSVLAQHFGDKADAVSLAIEKEAKLSGKPEKIPDAPGIGREADDLDGTDYAKRSMGAAFNAETGDRIEEGAVDSARYGLTPPDAAGKSRSKLDGLPMLENSQYARQHMLDLQEKYKSPEGEEPKYTVRFEKVPGSDKGHIVVERNGAPNDGDFAIGDLERIKLETKDYSKSPSRIGVDNLKLDAIKITRLMGERGGFNFESPDTLPSAFRSADMFKRGIAQLTQQFGKNIEIPDSTVIAYNGGEPFTWGEAQKLRRETAADKAADANAQLLTDLRKQYLQATASPKKLAKLGLEQKELSPERVEGLISAAQKLNKDAEYIKNRELSADNNSESAPLTARAKAMNRLKANHERHLDNIEKKGVPRDQIEARTDMGEFPFEERGRFDAEGNLTRDAAIDLLQGDYHGGIDINDRSTHELDRVNYQETRGEGRTAIGKDENITRVAATMSEKDMVNRSNMDGSPQNVSDKKSGINLKPIIGIANELREGEFASAGSKKIGDRLATLIKNRGLMRESDVAKLQTITTEMSAYEIGVIINPIATKYKETIIRAAAPESAKVEGAKARLEGKLPPIEFDKNPVKFKDGKVDEGTPDPKSVAAKKAALLEAASSSDPALLQELSTTDDARALQRTVAELPPGPAADAANARMSELVQDKNVAYDLTKSGPTKTDTAATRQAVEQYIKTVLGDSVKLKFAELSHAGEFERMRLNDIIRLSTTALDPMSVAHHEALHAFFAQLRDAKANDIIAVLDKAASSDNVIRQLNELYKGNDPVLAQLKDPEERAAYMYQHWAAGDLTIGSQPRNVLSRVADFIRSVLGIWSNDQRALAILEHFNSGKYAASGRDVALARRQGIEKGQNQALEAAKSLTAPLARVADAVVATGSGRLRDTGIPSLRRLADIIKREGTDTRGGDQGFIAAARIEATKRNTALAESLKDYSQDELHEAMEALQRGRGYSGTNAARVRQAQAIIKKTLADTFSYLKDAGVNIGDLGPDYFPRVWDSHYISKNQQAFKDMLEPYIRRGEHKGSADDLIRSLVARDGSEFGIDREKLNFDEITARPPGMQFKKTRTLAYITPEDAAMFVNKDLLGTLTTYISQSARKAEWTRRLGDGKLEAIFDKAKEEGATTDQLKLADTYLRGVDGTLGDNINPHARRIMGNMIVYQNIRLLPFAAFSSVVDPAGVLVRGGSVRDAFETFKRGVSEIPKGLGRKGKNDRATEIAELVGVIDSAVLADTLGDVYTQGMVGGFAKKANTFFFKANLMEGLNRSFRVGASEAAIKFIAKHADGTDSRHSQRWINELGLEPGDIKPTADGRIALTTSDGLSLGQERRVHAAINQWVDGAVLRPDAADKPIWFNDPHFALISHLKQFVYSFQKTILERVVHEFKQGNYTPAMALAGYVPVMLGADFIKGLIQGGGEQPEWKKGWDMADYLGYAAQRGGLLGVGQFGLDIAKDVQRGGIGVGALTGPTIEQFGDAVQLLGGHKQFGPMVLNALPANALYAHAFGHSETPDPMQTE